MVCTGAQWDSRPLSGAEMAAQTERLRAALRAAGHAVTAPRLATYEGLLAANGHTCAPHLLEAIRRTNPARRVHKTTIYRTLDLLESLGLAYTMRRDNGCTQYEAAVRPRHGHLICRRCGAVQDLAPALERRLRRALWTASGFAADLTGGALSGLCRRCAQRRP